MKTSFRDLLNQAKRLIGGEFADDYRFSNEFHFARCGEVAYELVLDASPSMADTDYPPTRFAAAKTAAKAFLKRCTEQTPEALASVLEGRLRYWFIRDAVSWSGSSRHLPWANCHEVTAWATPPPRQKCDGRLSLRLLHAMDL